MNKLEGFYELNRLGIPSVPWKEYNPEITFDENILWTIRVAINKGNDFDLPRAIGVKNDIAKKKADEFYNQYSQMGIVIYYPFFSADKSGIVEICNKQIVVEAVEKDLWHLATEGRRDETIIINNSIQRYGKAGFVTDSELQMLVGYISIVKSKLRDFIFEGKSVYLEWSFAKKVNINGFEIGEGYLVFYECKAI